MVRKCSVVFQLEEEKFHDPLMEFNWRAMKGKMLSNFLFQFSGNCKWFQGASWKKHWLLEMPTKTEDINWKRHKWQNERVSLIRPSKSKSVLWMGSNFVSLLINRINRLIWSDWIGSPSVPVAIDRYTRPSIVFNRLIPDWWRQQHSIERASQMMMTAMVAGNRCLGAANFYSMKR